MKEIADYVSRQVADSGARAVDLSTETGLKFMSDLHSPLFCTRMLLLCGCRGLATANTLTNSLIFAEFCHYSIDQKEVPLIWRES